MLREAQHVDSVTQISVELVRKPEAYVVLFTQWLSHFSVKVSGDSVVQLQHTEELLMA